MRKFIFDNLVIEQEYNWTVNIERILTYRTKMKVKRKRCIEKKKLCYQIVFKFYVCTEKLGNFERGWLKSRKCSLSSFYLLSLSSFISLEREYLCVRRRRKTEWDEEEKEGERKKWKASMRSRASVRCTVDIRFSHLQTINLGYKSVPHKNCRDGDRVCTTGRRLAPAIHGFTRIRGDDAKTRHPRRPLGAAPVPVEW